MSDYVLKSNEVLVFPLVKEELQLLYDNPVAFSSYINVWYDGEGYSDSNKKSQYDSVIKNITDHEDDWLYHTYWMIVSINKRTIVGSIRFDGKPINDSCIVHYGFNNKHNDMDYVSHAILLFAEWAVGNGIKTIETKISSADNVDCDLLQKAGFNQTKSTKNYTWYRLTYKGE